MRIYLKQRSLFVRSGLVKAKVPLSASLFKACMVLLSAGSLKAMVPLSAG